MQQLPKPHSLTTIALKGKSRQQVFEELGPIAKRHGRFPKGTVLPETYVLTCPRVRVADLPEDFLKKSHIEHLEQNQLLSSCCRHPENHFVEAGKSHPDEEAPDRYNFICDKCGKTHRFFCVGMHDDNRPVWSAG